MRKISIAIPTFNRYQLTIDSFSQVINDERISEIIISDDCSTDGSYVKLVEHFRPEPKVKVYQTEKNLDCYFNKHRGAELATGDWIIIFDSDNTLKPEYLDAIYAIPQWDKDTLYQPEYSKPYFDFRKWSGLIITKENVSQYVNTDLMTALNAFNLFINRDQYLRVWDGSVNPITSDSIYFNYCWLKAGNKIYITPGLQYDHYIAKDKSGHYQQNQHKTIEFHKKLMAEIRELK